MSTLTVNIIGAGHVGCTLARLCQQAHTIDVKGIINRSMTSAQAAAAFIGDGTPVADLHALPDSACYWLGCGDDQIESVSYALAQAIDLQGKTVIHFSGAKSTSELAAAKQQGAWVASVHPIHSFAKPEASLQHFAGSYCALQGDEKALQQIKPALAAIGARFFILQEQDKALHHANGAFANNFVIALAQAAMTCYKNTDVDPKVAKTVTLQLMRQALNNIAYSDDVIHALSGPLRRGDISTISQHLQALDVPEKTVYQALAQYLLAHIGHNNSVRDTLIDLLH